MLIQTLTTQYDATQDRIALALADAEQQRFKLWLTRRLLLRLVPALLDGLLDQIDATPDAVPPEAWDAAVVYAQLQARVSKKPTAPVRTDEHTPHGLVRAIDIRPGRRGAKTLTFRCPELPTGAQLALSANELRQWLEALKLAADQGHWQVASFPPWLGGLRADPAD